MFVNVSQVFLLLKSLIIFENLFILKNIKITPPSL